MGSLDSSIGFNQFVFTRSIAFTPPGWTSKEESGFVVRRPDFGGFAKVIVEKVVYVNQTYCLGYLLVPDVDFTELSGLLNQYQSVTPIDNLSSEDKSKIGTIINPVTGMADVNAASFRYSDSTIPEWIQLPNYGTNAFVAHYDSLTPYSGDPVFARIMKANGDVTQGIPFYRPWAGSIKRSSSGPVAGPDGSMVALNPGDTAGNRLIFSTTTWPTDKPCCASVYGHGLTSFSCVGKTTESSNAWRRFAGTDAPGTTNKAIRSMVVDAPFAFDFACFEQSKSPSAPAGARTESGVTVDWPGKFARLQITFSLSGGTQGAFGIDDGGLIFQSNSCSIALSTDGRFVSGSSQSDPIQFIPNNSYKFEVERTATGLLFTGESGATLATVVCDNRDRQIRLFENLNGHLHFCARRRT